MSFEPKLDWKYDDDVTEQHFNRWEKGIKEAHDNIATSQLENIGYGVHAGLEVLASAIPDMNVHAQSGVGYPPNGERYDFTSVKTFAIAAADATNPRIDIIFVSALGVIEYLSGTSSATPVKPALPSGALELCEVNVAAGAMVITQEMIVDTRIMKGNLPSLQHEVVEHKADYVQHPGFGVTAGTNNEYTVTLNPAPISYAQGMGVALAIHADSTGVATLNINGLGAKKILKANGNAVTNLKFNGVYTVRYNPSADGGNGAFILQGEGGEYGTAGPGDVLEGKSIGTDTGLKDGTIKNNGAGGAITPGTTDIVKPAGYYSSSITIKGDPDKIPANIKAGVDIDGVLGTLKGIKSIQRGTTVNFYGDVKINISTVSVNNSIIIVQPKYYTGANSNAAEWFIKAEFWTASQIRLTKFGTQSTAFDWTVVEFSSAKVEILSGVIPTGTLYADFTVKNRPTQDAGLFILNTYRQQLTSADSLYSAVDYWYYAPDKIRLSRSHTSGGVEFVMYIVEAG